MSIALMKDKKIKNLRALFNNPLLTSYHGESANLLLSRLIESNEYTVMRGLQDYTKAFGISFLNALNSLKAQDHWVDAGAGNALAQADFEEELLELGRPIPRMTAITYRFAGILPQNGSRRTIISNRKFEDISNEEIHKAKLVTDFTGVLNYTSQPQLVLQKYLDNLEVDGKLFVLLPPHITYVQTRDNCSTLVDWLGKVFGESLTHLEDSNVFTITKGLQPFVIPKLTLVSAFHHHYVFRLFSEET